MNVGDLKFGKVSGMCFYMFGMRFFACVFCLLKYVLCFFYYYYVYFDVFSRFIM